MLQFVDADVTSPRLIKGRRGWCQHCRRKSPPVRV